MGDSSYEVGYGRPPKGPQFTKGQSGNPKGRPKGSKNLATIMLRESRQPVRVQGPRGSRTVSKLEATVMQLQNKAVQGDLPSQRLLFALVRLAEERTEEDGVVASTMPEADHKVMQSIVRRMERASKLPEQGLEKAPE